MINIHKTYRLLLLLTLIPLTAAAQTEADYFTADQLLREQKYEQAYRMFKQLHRQNPGSYLFLDKTAECLIKLKRYDAAADLVKKAVENGRFKLQGSVRLAEIYHISGNKTAAFNLWNRLLEQYEGNSSLTLNIAQAMVNRGEYERAIRVYKKVINRTNSTVYITALAETYLLAGEYDKAIQQFLQLVQQEPSRIGYVQTKLIRLQNAAMYNTAIDEIAEFLQHLPPGHPSYNNVGQLRIWLLMEQDSFNKALKAAEKLEAASPNTTYELYNVGSKLRARNEFELAERAFAYYVENRVFGIQNRSLEELSKVYLQWAAYLERHNLDLSPRTDQLYQKAFATLQKLATEAPGYPRMGSVLVTLSELSLDVRHNPQLAADFLAQLQNRSDTSLTAQINFIGGRIQLYEKNYARARILFTESAQQSNNRQLAVKSRYYLALTDLYAGDFEFALLQMKELERQNTSFYANNALQLRLWIQDGLQADSTGEQMKPFVNAVELFSRGHNEAGTEQLKMFLNSHHYHLLFDDALLELSKNKTGENIVFTYNAISKYVATYGSSSPLHERLLWEKARIADQLITNGEIRSKMIRSGSNNAIKAAIPSTMDQLIDVYEEIILHFPNGFYATHARDRIQELQKMNT